MSPQQKKVLDFVTERLKATSLAPSLQEIADHLGHKSKTHAHENVAVLIRNGHLVRTGERVRALALPPVSPVELAAIPTSALHAELERRLGRELA